MKHVNKSGIIFCLMVFLVALFFFIPALSFPAGSKDGAPGPGYFPLIVSVIVMILSVAVGIGYLHDEKKYFQQDDVQKGNLKKMLIIAGGVTVYTIIFKYIPFIPLSITFIFFLNWMFDRELKSNIVFTIILVVFLYVVFGKFLHVMI